MLKPPTSTILIIIYITYAISTRNQSPKDIPVIRYCRAEIIAVFIHHLRCQFPAFVNTPLRCMNSLFTPLLGLRCGVLLSLAWLIWILEIVSLQLIPQACQGWTGHDQHLLVWFPFCRSNRHLWGKQFSETCDFGSPRVQTNLMFSSWIWRYWRVITGIIPQVQQVTSHPSELWYRKGSTPITHLNHCKSRSVVDQKPVDLVSYMCIPLATWVSPEIQRRPSALGLGRSCPANCRHFMWLGPGKFVHLWPSNPWNLWGNLGKWAVKSLRYLDVYTPVLG